jgi:hypothetical protein
MKEDEWVSHVVHMGEMRKSFKILVGKPLRKRLFGRHRRRWEDKIKMYLKETRC